MLGDLYDCYRMLEVEPGATLEEVKRSYRELVKVWHPDRFEHDPKLRDKAVEKLKKINLAYERICAAGETFRSPPPPADDRGGEWREARAAYEQHRTTGRRTSRQSTAEPPPPSPPTPPPPSAREIWLRRLRYGGPLAGIVVSTALIYVLYPQPQPRFLIDLPPEAPPPTAPAAAPAQGSRSRQRSAAPTVALPPPKLFGVGSTKAEVIEAQGKPDRSTDALFVYGTSDVHFENGKVKSWRSGFPRLKVRMVAAPNLGGREYFTVGSTKDQVIHAQGTPDSFTETSFTYGTSKVYFANGKVKSWRVMYPALNARLLPKASVGKRAHFTVGSTKDEVLAAQGTPDAFTDTEFSYGTSRVYFKNGRVHSWHDRIPRLNSKAPLS